MTCPNCKLLSQRLADARAYALELQRGVQPERQVSWDGTDLFSAAVKELDRAEAEARDAEAKREGAA